VKRNAKARPASPVDRNQRYDVAAEAAPYLRLAPSTVWQKIKDGEIAIMRDRGRVYVPGSEIIRLSTLSP
jgi:hypothetical protein